MEEWLFLPGVALIVVLWFAARRHLDSVWLEDWAAGRGCEILDKRRLFWGGLGWALRASFARWPLPTSTAAFRVTVRDRHGDTRQGKVLLVRGTLWLRDHVETDWGGTPAAEKAQDAIRRFRAMQEREQSDG